MTMLEALTQWGGEVEDALARFDGDEEMYVTCLHIFAKDENFALLGEQMAAGDYEAAFDSAHTLKGVSANLSLTPLYQVICLLVEALRHKEYDRAVKIYPALHKAQESFCKLVKESV
ncbi:MAG: Hpt domain-containing protein [Acidaminococcaceae bacterium]